MNGVFQVLADLIAQDESIPVGFGNFKPADQNAAGGSGKRRNIRGATRGDCIKTKEDRRVHTDTCVG